MLWAHKIALIGAGNMSEALIAGLLKAGRAARERLRATDVRAARCKEIQQRYQIQVSSDNVSAAKWADIVILSVEPQVMDEVLHGIRGALNPKHFLVSVAAGYPIARVLRHAGRTAKVVRAMPNTPSSVLEGVSALVLGPGLSEQEASLARAIFECVGKVIFVEERLMDAVTGLSGSGPAYVYLMIEALADGGVKMGLARPVAELLATQTVLGAAKMLMESGEHPGQLKDRVASPGGTTIAGLHRLEQGRFRATLIAAVEAATKRSKELGKDERSH